MSQLDWNSGSHVSYFDPTSSAAPSGFDESTAPNGNLASIMRNWVLVQQEPRVDEPNEIPPAPALPEDRTAN